MHLVPDEFHSRNWKGDLNVALSFAFAIGVYLLSIYMVSAHPDWAPKWLVRGSVIFLISVVALNGLWVIALLPMMMASDNNGNGCLAKA